MNRRSAENDANASGNNYPFVYYIATGFRLEVAPSLLKKYTMLLGKMFYCSTTAVGTLDLHVIDGYLNLCT